MAVAVAAALRWGLGAVVVAEAAVWLQCSSSDRGSSVVAAVWRWRWQQRCGGVVVAAVAAAWRQRGSSSAALAALSVA